MCSKDPSISIRVVDGSHILSGSDASNLSLLDPCALTLSFVEHVFSSERNFGELRAKDASFSIT